MKKSGKNYRSQLGMSKSAAEQIILATLVGEWVRDQYHPRGLNDAISTAHWAIDSVWGGDQSLSFLQSQAAAREAFKQRLITDAYDPMRPENIVYAATVSELLLTGVISPDSLESYWHLDREIHLVVSDARSPTIPEWTRNAVSLYRWSKEHEDAEREAFEFQHSMCASGFPAFDEQVAELTDGRRVIALRSMSRG
jgi:hypothetical protein